MGALSSSEQVSPEQWEAESLAVATSDLNSESSTNLVLSLTILTSIMPPRKDHSSSSDEPSPPINDQLDKLIAAINALATSQTKATESLNTESTKLVEPFIVGKHSKESKKGTRTWDNFLISFY
ncbi:hypothetical protein E3N88_16124 [Mikania micrantha]|uniref:Uncharacterized protein n=1 Tax=Mikania micrantha TaxID=192012 RepID=A0A5N6NXK4_9ASTR|nr:hypothetical protein E3N88_16124 [Mikania micrantha]